MERLASYFSRNNDDDEHGLFCNDLCSYVKSRVALIIALRVNALGGELTTLEATKAKNAGAAIGSFMNDYLQNCPKTTFWYIGSTFLDAYFSRGYGKYCDQLAFCLAYMYRCMRDGEIENLGDFLSFSYEMGAPWCDPDDCDWSQSEGAGLYDFLSSAIIAGDDEVIESHDDYKEFLTDNGFFVGDSSCTGKNVRYMLDTLNKIAENTEQCSCELCSLVLPTATTKSQQRLYDELITVIKDGCTKLAPVNVMVGKEQTAIMFVAGYCEASSDGKPSSDHLSCQNRDFIKKMLELCVFLKKGEKDKDGG